jgi:hypothetical protein
MTRSSPQSKCTVETVPRGMFCEFLHYEPVDDAPLPHSPSFLGLTFLQHHETRTTPRNAVSFKATT